MSDFIPSGVGTMTREEEKNFEYLSNKISEIMF